MSRREEVEASIIGADGAYHESAWLGPESLRHLARTLAAEVDQWKEIATGEVETNVELRQKLFGAEATLAALREVVPEILPPHMSWKASLGGARAILYPEGRDND